MNRQHTDTAASVTQAIFILRLIGASLGAGVTMFALVAWFANRQGPTAAIPGDPTLMFALVLALAVGAVTAAIALWRARVEPLIGRTGGADDPAARMAPIQSNVIIVWAIVEGAALLAVVVHYLYAAALAGALGVVLIWGTLAATWPKREWIDGSR